MVTHSPRDSPLRLGLTAGVDKWEGEMVTQLDMRVFSRYLGFLYVVFVGSNGSDMWLEMYSYRAEV